MKLTLVLLLLALTCCSSDEIAKVVVFLSLAGTEADSCPPDWINFQSHCYSLKKIARNWNAAEADCQTHGSESHLASIRSEKENAFGSFIAGENDPGFPVWIGLFSFKGGGRSYVRWTDNTNVDYTAWADGDPGKRGYCVEISADVSLARLAEDYKA
ncbi:LOW QUALITY PROTEIN: snaclec 1-like [Lacerta agilis]|uniref:LOW QUALITY PROTEIN: snaclec 1-like n=1 Tax=Lacerta agilis TaxID=80427 RepID=UPI0014195325|nr:LOW QUALITY PROTEIN: snaclec 1-like [Lacerta agilis]